MINTLVGPNSSLVLKQIVEEVAGSWDSSSLSFLPSHAILEAIESLAIQQSNETIEEMVKSNSRMEKIRVWFNNKG